MKTQLIIIIVIILLFDLIRSNSSLRRGNHSATQFPDAKHATVKVGNVEKSVYDAVGDESYLKTDFVTTIQKRGAAVIAARKMSSAMSAAKAASDHMHDWYVPFRLKMFKILIAT